MSKWNEMSRKIPSWFGDSLHDYRHHTFSGTSDELASPWSVHRSENGEVLGWIRDDPNLSDEENKHRAISKSREYSTHPQHIVGIRRAFGPKGERIWVVWRSFKGMPIQEPEEENVYSYYDKTEPARYSVNNPSMSVVLRLRKNRIEGGKYISEPQSVKPIEGTDYYRSKRGTLFFEAPTESGYNIKPGGYFRKDQGERRKIYQLMREAGHSREAAQSIRDARPDAVLSAFSITAGQLMRAGNNELANRILAKARELREEQINVSSWGKNISLGTEANPKRPPSNWWRKMYHVVKRQYPNLTEDDWRRITGGIWQNYSAKSRKKITKMEEQKVEVKVKVKTAPKTRKKSNPNEQTHRTRAGLVTGHETYPYTDDEHYRYGMIARMFEGPATRKEVSRAGIQGIGLEIGKKGPLSTTMNNPIRCPACGSTSHTWLNDFRGVCNDCGAIIDGRSESAAKWRPPSLKTIIGNKSRFPSHTAPIVPDETSFKDRAELGFAMRQVSGNRRGGGQKLPVVKEQFSMNNPILCPLCGSDNIVWIAPSVARCNNCMHLMKTGTHGVFENISQEDWDRIRERELNRLISQGGYLPVYSGLFAKNNPRSRSKQT